MIISRQPQDAANALKITRSWFFFGAMACLRPSPKSRFVPLHCPGHVNSRGIRPFAAVASQEDAKVTTTSRIVDGIAHVNAVVELKAYFARSTVMNNVTILDILRQHYPQYTVTESFNNIFTLVKAGKAKATLDAAPGFYGLRRYEEPDEEEGRKEGRHVNGIELGHYDYFWNGHKFHVFKVSFLKTYEYRTHNQYILYPKEQDNTQNGQSETVDALIQASAAHE